jgi:copper transport protein
MRRLINWLVVGPVAFVLIIFGATAALAADAVPQDHPEVKLAAVMVRVVGYLAMAVFIGGLAFVALLWPAGTWDRRTRRLLVIGWLGGALTTVASIGLQGAYAAQLPLRAAYRPTVFASVLDDHPGDVWAVKGLLWLLAAIVLAWALRDGEQAIRSAAWRVAAIVVGLGLLRTTGMTAHAVDAQHAFLSQTADLLHLTGISLWLGGLTVLLVGVLRRRRPADLAAVLPRYSKLALISVLTIASSGLILAWQLVGSVHALLTTSYGHLLLLKLGVLAVVLAAAQRSKRWVESRLDVAVVLHGDAPTIRPFLYSVAAEAALLMVVLSAAGLLVTASPGR